MGRVRRWGYGEKKGMVGRAAEKGYSEKGLGKVRKVG